MKGHAPRKRFGQNFLVEAGVIEKIVGALGVRRDERVVEIGPGLGALTAPLLTGLDCLHVVEIDRDLVARLRKRYAPERLVIHEGDALSFDFSGFGTDLRIVGNLPYNISTPLLFHLADHVRQLRDMHFMLQSEVVDRMVSEPSRAAYGRLSVMLQYRFDMERLFGVSPEAFDPAPKVESAFVRLVPKPATRLAARDETLFEKIVMAAFSQRRKMLRNTLRDLIDENALTALDIRPTARAEELGVDDYVRISNSLLPD